MVKSKSNITNNRTIDPLPDVDVSLGRPGSNQRGKPTKEQCQFTSDEKGKRAATAQEQKKCQQAAGIAVTDEGVPGDKNPSKPKK